jgi:ApbE superfamily uncharacterized protein (UPF0280 family)
LSKDKTTAAIGPMASVTGTLIGNYFGQICPDSYDKNGKETFDCVRFAQTRHHINPPS